MDSSYLAQAEINTNNGVATLQGLEGLFQNLLASALSIAGIALFIMLLWGFFWISYFRVKTIDIDGQDIASVTQDSLRENIAVVPQEPMLFHRSIRENIAYGKSNASEAEIRSAFRKISFENHIDYILPFEWKSKDIKLAPLTIL